MAEEEDEDEVPERSASDAVPFMGDAGILSVTTQSNAAVTSSGPRVVLPLADSARRGRFEQFFFPHRIPY